MEEFPLYRAAFSGLLAMLASIGIARFGYAPLVPALVAAHWVSAPAAFWLGASNLLGYLIGAAVMRSWRGAIRTKALVVGLMALTAFSVLASAWNFGLIYAGIWRVLTGMTGGALMVLMGAAVVGRAPAAARGKAGGITFAGMGAGIMMSALVIPRILPFGLPETWGMLGSACVLATIIVAAIMPESTIPARVKMPGSAAINLPVLLIIIAYGLVAVGFVPHILFWASFIALGLHRGIAAGAAYSALLGLAATLGPPILGRFADRLGFVATLSAAYFAMAAATLCPLIVPGPFGLAVSSIGVGVVALGVVVLTSGALAGLLPPARLSSTWGLATLSYSTLQAVSAAGFSTLFHATGSYRLLYAIAAAATFCAGALVAAAAYAARGQKFSLRQ
jgi:predicted MFS family arabinose efflux permease